VLGLASERESFGQVIVEAMACGVPPVVTAAEGPARIVADGETGWVVPVDEPGALADALAAAASDPAERARRGADAARVAHERYAWPVVAAALGDVLYSVAPSS
jgi:glycosyltransferase involved in cell wall biosynthesis